MSGIQSKPSAPIEGPAHATLAGDRSDEVDEVTAEVASTELERWRTNCYTIASANHDEPAKEPTAEMGNRDIVKPALVQYFTSVSSLNAPTGEESKSSLSPWVLSYSVVGQITEHGPGAEQLVRSLPPPTEVNIETPTPHPSASGVWVDDMSSKGDQVILIYHPLSLL
jgi:hypothetical protein